MDRLGSEGLSRAHAEGIRIHAGLRERRISADYIADAVRAAILSGDLADGAVLNQAALAQRFGVSRVPVREAIRQLQAEGLVEARAHRVALVRALDAERIGELFALRAVLEGWLVEQAASRIGPDRLASAARLNEAMRLETEHAAWLELNARFHECLVAPSRAVTTIELLEGLRRRTERYARLWIAGPHVRRHQEAHREHAEILSLLAAGEAAPARAALERHVLRTRDRVIHGARFDAAPERA